MRDDKKDAIPVATRETIKAKKFLVLPQADRIEEIVVAGVLYRVEPGQPLPLDEAVVKHPDFQAQTYRFGVTEVRS